MIYGSCGNEAGDWAVGDDPKHARHHLSGCRLVSENEERNQPIAANQPKFNGCFISPTEFEPTTTNSLKKKETNPPKVSLIS